MFLYEKRVPAAKKVKMDIFIITDLWVVSIFNPCASPLLCCNYSLFNFNEFEKNAGFLQKIELNKV